VISTISFKAQSPVVALFVSDVHLTPKLSNTTQTFINFLESYVDKVEHMFLLGDLFEAWAGDDDMESKYHQSIIKALQKFSESGSQLYWIAGNRDFLIGEQFAQRVGMTLLPDPSCFTLANQTFLLAHGDAQCTDDIAYMEFRSMVRQKQWQDAFLARPLLERKTIIEQMREASIEGQKQKTMSIMDVNSQAIDDLFTSHQVKTIIHGHTHRPCLHQEQQGLRYVLPDWDCDAEAPMHRGGWLTLNTQGEFLFHTLENETSLDWHK
jgi:UDP-2,3-diacylglucosamine hydrolase